MSTIRSRIAALAAVLAVSTLPGRPATAAPPASPAAIQLDTTCGGPGPLPAVTVSGIQLNPFTAVLVTFDAATGGTPESFDAQTDGFGAFHATIQPRPRPAGSYLVRADDFRDREATATFTVPCGVTPTPPPTFQPTMRFVPPITRVNFVVALRGTGFPPDATVSLRWGGVFGRAFPGRGLPASVTTGPDGTLQIRGVLVFAETALGSQTVTAAPGGPETFTQPVSAKLLVVAGTLEPPGFKERR